MASEIPPPFVPARPAETQANPPAPTAAPSGARGLLSAVTVADGLMALIGVAAAVLRLGELARLPLSAAEATAALPGWQFWSAAPLTLPVISPAYFAFTNLVMVLGGSGDAAARLVPAVFGLLTVLLPWLWRKRLRPAAWLIAGVFMAVSPLLVAVSRTAGGDAIALFALMLLVVAGSNRGHGRHWLLVAGAALGLGLTTSPLFYTGLVGLAAAAALARIGRADIPAADGLERYGRADLRNAGIAAAVVFFAVATSLLFYPAGIGAALRLLPAWLAQFGLPAAETGRAESLLSPFLILLRYEPAIFILGLPAVAWSFLNDNRTGRVLSLWLAFLFLLMLMQSGAPANAAAALLPAYLLVGLPAASPAVQWSSARPDGRRMSWYVALAILGLGALLLTAVGRFARLNLLTGQNATLIGLATLAFVLAGLAVVLAIAWDNPAARRGAFMGVALLLLFWQWGAAWQLSRLGANDPRERWVTAGTDDDVPVMIDLLTRVSRQTVNSDRDLTIFSQVDSPVLRWYLRDFPGYQAGPALPLNTQADVVITPAEAEPALPNDYFGADFALEQQDIANAGPTIAADAIKWWLFRESAAPVETRRVVVWLRSDLAASP